MRFLIQIILIILISGCASSEEEVRALKVSLPSNSSMIDVERILGSPIEKFYGPGYTVYYYCENPTWKTMKHRYVWFNSDSNKVGEHTRDVKGVICDKRIPKPSYAGAHHGDFSLYLPVSSRYDEDVLKTCNEATREGYLRPASNFATLDFDSPHFLRATNNTDKGSFTAAERDSFLSLLILINDCVAFSRIGDNMFRKFGDDALSRVPDQIWPQVSYDTKEALGNYLINVQALLKLSVSPGMTKGEFSKRLSSANKTLKVEEQAIIAYVFDFTKKLALSNASAPKTEVTIKNKTKVRVSSDSIIPRCAATMSCNR